MHSSRMRTHRSSPYGGSLSRGVSVRKTHRKEHGTETLPEGTCDHRSTLQYGLEMIFTFAAGDLSSIAVSFVSRLVSLSINVVFTLKQRSNLLLCYLLKFKQNVILQLSITKES